jgi:hypothetical protein
MKRRDFVTLLGGAAAAWPLAARAQQGERMRRIGVLLGSPNDTVGHANATALVHGLGALGWQEASNLPPRSKNRKTFAYSSFRLRRPASTSCDALRCSAAVPII